MVIILQSSMPELYGINKILSKKLRKYTFNSLLSI